jgi:hypothetical protein
MRSVGQLAVVVTVMIAQCIAPAGSAAEKGASVRQPRLLKPSIVGSSSCDSDPCYSKVMKRLPVQRVLLRLAAGPVDAVDVNGLLNGEDGDLKDLTALGLIRRDGNLYRLNFALFTASDQRRIREVSERWAASLAAAVLERRGDIEDALHHYDAPGVDRGAVAFFVLGCASLDWDGLALTAEEGYRKATGEHPDGEYVPVALEVADLSLKRIYWGSSYTSVDGIGLTSFGDHHALPRLMFPDLLYRVPDYSSTVPDPLRASLDSLLRMSVVRSIGTLARTMLVLRDGEKGPGDLAAAVGVSEQEVQALLDLMVKLDYVREDQGRFSARIPVLTQRDEAMVSRLRAIGREVMKAWLAKNFEAIRSELKDLSFTRSGVPFEEGFTMIWHYLFGMANQHLVEAGLFADPYSPSRRFQGAIPVVSALDLHL